MRHATHVQAAQDRDPHQNAYVSFHDQRFPRALVAVGNAALCAEVFVGEMASTASALASSLLYCSKCQSPNVCLDAGQLVCRTCSKHEVGAANYYRLASEKEAFCQRLGVHMEGAALHAHTGFFCHMCAFAWTDITPTLAEGTVCIWRPNPK